MTFEISRNGDAGAISQKPANGRRLFAPRIIVGMQLASLAAMVALSRADSRMLGDFSDLAMACAAPVLLAYLFSLFIAPWIVIASAWRQSRVSAVVLELGIVLALLYAALPAVQ